MALDEVIEHCEEKAKLLERIKQIDLELKGL